MDILLVTQYFPPEVGAPSARAYEHGRQWVAAGHKVTVLTAFPNHPNGVVQPDYRGRGYMEEEVDGMDLRRSWIYAVPNAGFFRRTLSFVSFMLSAIVTAGWKRPSCEVVIATSPQFFCALAGWVIALLLRKPFVLEVRDLWPETIIALGLLRRGALVTRILESMELFLYRRADRIVVVTEAFQRNMIQRGVCGEKIAVVTNGVDLSLFGPQSGQELRREHQLEGKFTVLYIGTHGMCQGLLVVLKAARALAERESIHFLFVGEGAEKEMLQRTARQWRLDNVTFLNQQPKAMVPRFIAVADLCLVPLRKEEVFTTVIPSKIFEIMACARPLIINIRGEASHIVEQAGCGLCVEPEDGSVLAEAILKLADETGLAAALGEAGRRYVLAHFDRRKLADRMAAFVESAVGDRRCGS